MEKNNFKVHFSNILSEKYNFSKEQINGYWANKKKEEEEDKNNLITFGKSIVVLTTSAGIIRCGDILDNIYGNIVVAAGFVGLCASCKLILAAMKSNPYKLKENKEIDNEYVLAKKAYIKNKK